MQLQTLEEITNHREYAVTLVADKVRQVFTELPDEIKCMDEHTLTEHFEPTPSDFWIRKNLWSLVELGEKVATVLICGNRVSTEYFYSKLLKNNYRVAWIFTPWKSHQENFEEAFTLLHDKLTRYVLKTDINAKNVGQLTKLYEHLANRAVGPVAKNINLRGHIHQTSDQPQKSPQELENELRQLKSATPVIDVDPT